MTKKFPNNLKTRRKKRNLTQRELAEQTGISFRMIQFYEQGIKNLTHAPCDKVFNLASVLKCSVAELFLESEFKTQVEIYEANILRMLIKGIRIR